MKLILVLLLVCQVAWASNCKQLLTGDATDRLTSYLGQLVEEHMVGDAELTVLFDSIDQPTLSNLFSEDQAAIDAIATIHREGLENLISDTSIDRLRLKRWIEKSLTASAQKQVQRSEVQEETAVVFQKMTFHPIAPGVELAAYPVTEWQWAMISGKSSALWQDAEDVDVVSIRGTDVKMHINHPMQRVTYYDVVDYIANLNKLSDEDNKLIYEVIPDHKKGDHYRLPAFFEWDIVASNRGTQTPASRFGKNGETLNESAWTKEDGTWPPTGTRPVGSRKPIHFDGYDFYDMYGNVAEWTPTSETAGKLGIRTVSMSYHEPFHLVVGGSHSSSRQDIVDDGPVYKRATLKSHDLGFRLVRERMQ